MKLVSIDKVRPGDVLGKNVLDEAGQVLLHAGVELKPSYIQSLKMKGYTRLFIRDSSDLFNVEPDEDLRPETRAKALSTLRNVYKAIEKETEALRRNSVEDIQKVFASDRLKAFLKSDGPLGQIKTLMAFILDEVLSRATLAGMTSIKCTDSALYEHSIDVCVASVLVATNLGLPYHRLRQLAVGALLHDIGMIFIEKGLPEPVRVRHHTILGYELLRNSEDRDILAPHVAYEHHEHQDGTGLPRGLVGSNTVARAETENKAVPTLVGEIVAVTNAYDVLLSGSGDSPPLTPDKAINVLQQRAGTHYNREVVKAFLRVVPVFPKGTEIIVTEGDYIGYTGIVLQVNIVQLDRPLIALCRDKEGNAIEPIIVNLAQEPDISIRAIWDI